ncbi:MAG: class II fructose-bisphosphatase [Ruminobacter sp.]|uniref:class II fructose-bisphosphatase n=1 Tax=Ruminobacter sp. TaxID=2774296 RepID=UPI001B6EABEA|nr:class II fructose-bisphosphatase [Ruminobacter sp.]MBP3748136.1 class II fructose-bisphosphatase [Ruminobacter sp.]
MKRELSLEFCRVTEAAALAGYHWLGRGDKASADDAAVKAMRYMLNDLDIDGEIVIGEGEIDEAPMLYIGEHVGNGSTEVDIAVDPIDGTRMTAMGQNNAVAVLAAADKGGFLKAPDMYMEKLIVGSDAKGVIDLNVSLEENIYRIARAVGKKYSDLTCVTLAKPRHEKAIKTMHELGLRVYAIPDGDVAASVLTCMPDSDIDFLYCIGGAPEGVISAAVARSLEGDMQGRLIPRHIAKGDTPENRAHGENEIARCKTMGIEPLTVLKLEDMVRTDSIIVSITGITKGDLLDGVTLDGNIAKTESIMIRGTSKTVRRIKALHTLPKKSQTIYDLVFGNGSSNK